MSIVSAIVTYLMVWWVVLFTVLPWRNEPVLHPLQGHDKSAPRNPQILFKLLITTLISSILSAIIYFLIKNTFITLN
ncbi:DUF1467 family protein [Candidatus Nucleicultrix amoebiphila]|uniref:DUF1467 family protein n=1 Tax=Candidatus Nucleicultrix amoebiphila FS5 TaxID=1414854 RepID=A0A1W6N6I6_9PROT|nr:DUF1467 family protein [Candidatus Nucleicultrix amoebiphila]ARN85418.1 hypothetical protein GQ61_09115 [Candidatus Nucleicultrix amoebiphila FS5]